MSGRSVGDLIDVFANQRWRMGEIVSIEANNRAQINVFVGWNDADDRSEHEMGEYDLLAVRDFGSMRKPPRSLETEADRPKLKKQSQSQKRCARSKAQQLALKKRRKKRRKKQRLKCPSSSCSKTFAGKSGLMCHLGTKHCASVTKDQKRNIRKSDTKVCPLCDHDTATYAGFISHLGAKHSSVNRQ